MVGAGSGIKGCVVYLNTTNGISAGSGTNIRDCTVSRNGGHGIDAAADSIVAGCSATTNTLVGIRTGIRGLISDCIATANTDDGIQVGDASTVRDCNVAANRLDGIQAAANCNIVNNACANNGIPVGAGIHTTGVRNRIEKNHLVSNDIGLKVDSNVSIFIGNVAGGNSPNYDIANGNIGYAIQAPAGAAFSGNTGGTAFGASDPLANFSY